MYLHEPRTVPVVADDHFNIQITAIWARNTDADHWILIGISTDYREIEKTIDFIMNKSQYSTYTITRFTPTATK